MPILVKSDDVRKGRPKFITGGYGRHRCQWVKEEVVQIFCIGSTERDLSRSLKPILNNLLFVNKMKFSIIYWNDQIYVSLAIQYGREKSPCGFESLKQLLALSNYLEFSLWLITSLNKIVCT